MRYIIGLAFTFFYFSAISQISFPQDKINSDAKSILTKYELAINGFLNPKLDSKKRKEYSSSLKTYFSSTGVFVYNDLDSNTSDTSFLKMFKYIKTLNSNNLNIHKIKLDLSNPRFENVLEDTTLNEYVLKVHVKKKSSIRKISKIILSKDSINIDSIPTLQDSIKFDTTNSIKNDLLTFHFKLITLAGNYKAVRLIAISKFKTSPKYRKLDNLTEWWVNLDEDWKNRFRKELKITENIVPEGSLMRIEMLKELNLEKQKIKSLKHLSQAKKLTKLNLNDAEIENLEGIENLVELKELYINNTQIRDLSPLTACKKLRILHCQNLELESIDFVNNFKYLVEFDCSNNLLTDISPLANLEYLEVLNISLNQEIESIEPLRNKPNLTELRMRKMKVKDISAISTCYNMVVLDVFSNEIGTLSPISKLKKLTYLNCSFGKITTLAPIRNHRYITHLYINGNAITSIEELRNFQVLKVLEMARTSVISLNPIMSLPYLRKVIMHTSEITVEEKNRFKKKQPKCKITYY